MEKGYAGRIKNKGNQVVEAPFKTAAPKSPKVKTGKDLRAGKSGKQFNTLLPLKSERLQNGSAPTFALEIAQEEKDGERIKIVTSINSDVR